MNKTFCLVLIFLTSIFLTDAFAQDKQLQALQVDVVYLASDLLEGRETGTEGEAMAAQYISSRMEAIGLKPKGTDNSWYQPFDFKFSTNPHAGADAGEPRTGKNVVGFIDKGADKTIVIGAHYDHLGMGHFGSRHVGEKAIHNGADDNASGIAVMLQLAELLQQSNLNGNNYLFIAFSGEELGLYGSKYFADHATIELDKINFMLNMDMVGRLNEEKAMAVSGAGTSPAWKAILEALDVDGIQLKTSDSGVGPSDHTSFYLKEIPVLHFFTGQHQDYHKPEDDSDIVNYKGMQSVGKLIYALIESLDSTEKLKFTKTKDEQKGRTSFKVTLGIMPDYVYNEEGMKIDAALDDRPAQKAGLKGGDIVIKMGDVEIKGMGDYMKALGKFEKGQTIMVEYLRDGKKKKTKVTF